MVFGSLIAFSAYMYLVAHVSPALATSYAYVNPPVALLVGAWLGGETIAPETWTALPLILGAVALLAWAAARTPAGETVAQAQSFPLRIAPCNRASLSRNAIDEPRCSAR